jgi:hypothetical protein
MERQQGAGSNGTNVAWGLSSPPLLASVMDPHTDIQVSNQERGQARTEQVEILVAGPKSSPLTRRCLAPMFLLHRSLWKSLLLCCGYKSNNAHEKNSYQMKMSNLYKLPLINNLLLLDSTPCIQIYIYIYIHLKGTSYGEDWVKYTI